MKQRKRERERERKREQKETARNKIKEMLFHNANCAASITPPAHCTPLPFDHVSGINVECQANEATSSNCRRRETSPKAQYGNAAGNKKNAVFNVNYTTVTTRQHEEGRGRGGRQGGQQRASIIIVQM